MNTLWVYIAVNGFGPEWNPLSIKDSSYISQQLRKVINLLKQGDTDVGIYTCSYRTNSGDRLIFSSTHKEKVFHDIVNSHMRRTRDFNVFEQETQKEILERELDEILSKVVE